MNEYETVYDIHSKTYTALFHTGWHMLDIAETHELGSALNLQAAIVFFAFTFEAYLNHVGEEEIKFWDEIARVSHAKKLAILEKQLGFNKSKPPFQTVQTLFKLRDDFAHGRTIKKTIRKVTEVPKSPDDNWNLLPREQLTKEMARRYHDEIRASIELINDSRKNPDKFLWNEGSRSSVTSRLSS